MKIPKEELTSILAQLNPWWRELEIPDLPTWKRSVFNELLTWIETPPAMRAVLISGPRQVGKTTLLLQAIESLIQKGVPPSNILYATFDHPVFKLAGVDAVLEAWRELEPKADGPEYLFLDEAQFIRSFGTWTKHQVDFSKYRRIIFTGSAMPLVHVDQESGVGRWHTIRLSTLSFYEYLQIKKITISNIPSVDLLRDSLKYNLSEMKKVSEAIAALIGHFHEYLIRGGFPQTSLIESISLSQRLLREDIIDKVLKRDMTALFGVRRIIELEQMFIFLCMHDGGLQDITTLSKDLGITKPTVQNFIDLLESTHLVYRLPPYGYGKEVLRARYKLYLTDAAISPAILMKGKTILQDPVALGVCVETAVVGHLMAHTRTRQARFSYWRSSRDKEVDIVVEFGERLVPFEVKYRSKNIEAKDVLGLTDLFKQRPSIDIGYVLTKSPQDIGLLASKSHPPIMRIPAAIFCYWIGQSEISQRDLLN